MRDMHLTEQLLDVGQSQTRTQGSEWCEIHISYHGSSGGLEDFRGLGTGAACSYGVSYTGSYEHSE